MTGQDENPKPADQAVNRHKIINDDPEARDRNLQAFLNNGNFKAALTAHRVFDMQRHVGNLYKWFPDFQPPSDVLRELIEAGDKGGQFRLDQDQLRQVGKRMEQGKDYVKNAWLFVGTREVVVGYYYGIRAGHVIRDVISKQEQDQRMHGEDFMEAALSIEAPLAEESFKGMFARLGGDAEGIYLVQLDAGMSRALYDSDETEGKKEILSGFIPRFCDRKWININENTNPLLAITDHDLKIEHVVDVKQFSGLTGK